MKASPRFLACFAIFLAALVTITASPSAQTTASPSVAGSLFQDLKEYVETPAIPGYEKTLSEKIRSQLGAFRPQLDNMGNVTVTVGHGAPNRLLVASLDEPGYVVSGINDDGYLRLQRLPQYGNLPPVFEDLYTAQAVKVETSANKWIYGVVAGHSVHLERPTTEDRQPVDIEDVYVDVGATSKEEAQKNGADVLSAVSIDRNLVALGHYLTGYSVGDRFGDAALVELLRTLDASKVKGTLTVAFVVQQWAGARGLQRVIQKTKPDEMVYIGRLGSSGAIAGMKSVRRAPRREMGGGVLIGMPETGESLVGYPAELEQSAELNKIPMATDYAAPVLPPSRFDAAKAPSRSCHIGIATAWPATPAEMIDSADLATLARFLRSFAQSDTSSTPASATTNQSPEIPGNLQSVPANPKRAALIAQLVETYGVSGHEEAVRDAIRRELGPEAHTETDAAGNLILHLGATSGEAAPSTHSRFAPNSASPRILFVAHMDEIGFQVKSISKDGRLEVDWRGGGDLSFYVGHPAIVHTASASHNAVMELPDAWDQPAFVWPHDTKGAIRVDIGARNPDEVSRMGVAVGDWITIPKKYRPLLGMRANGRAFDDRVGCAALIAAVKAITPALKGRDVTFAWSTGEEEGLLGATALAKRLNDEGKVPDYVFAVDTFVSSDSPIESQRFADAQLGKGFVIRAIDNSNIAPPDLVDRLIAIAKARKIPVQYGVTGGGNDGSVYTRYGSIDIALGWPLRYSHSPAEVIDTRDLDALSRIIAEIAKSW